MPVLKAHELSDLLGSLPGWTITGGRLVREWRMMDFLQSISFVNQVADLAEAAGHHPDIDIRHTLVRLSLTSHDVGHLTDRDTAFAATINRAFPD